MAEAGSLKVSAQGSRTELLLQGHPVIDSYAELRRALDTRVSSDTAILFAEPRRVINLGIAWFDPMGSQDSVPVTTLAGEAREQAEATLTRMFRELEALFADEKIGVLILAALNVDADDSIRVVGSRLVLVGWGGLPVASMTQPNLTTHHFQTVGRYLPRTDFPILRSGTSTDLVEDIGKVPVMSLRRPPAAFVATAIALLVLILLLLPGVLRRDMTGVAALPTPNTGVARQLEEDIASRELALRGDVCLPTPTPTQTPRPAPGAPQQRGDGSRPGAPAPGADK